MVSLLLAAALVTSSPSAARASTEPAATAPKTPHRHTKTCRCLEQGRKWLRSNETSVEPVPLAANARPAVAAREPMRAANATTRPASFTAAAPAVPFRSATAPTEAISEERPLDIYRLNPLADAVVIGAGVVLTAGPALLSSKLIRPRGLGDPSTLNALDRSVIGNSNAAAGLASNITALVALALPVAIDFADVGAGPELFHDAVVMAEVLSVAGAAMSYAKYSTQRRSPLLYQAGGNVDDPNLYKSFVSWQTTLTFATLSATAFTLNERHDFGPWPWIATALIGGSVAAERVASGRAFYTDVAAGALLGVATGTLVPWLHVRGMAAMAGPTQGGMQVGATKRF